MKIFKISLALISILSLLSSCMTSHIGINKNLRKVQEITDEAMKRERLAKLEKRLQRKLERQYKSAAVRAPKQKFIAYGDKLFSYLDNENIGQPIFILIHGAPGDAHAFFKIMRDKRVASSFHLISVDRLGYGASDFGNSAPSFAEQVKPINILYRKMRQEFPQQKIFIAGHSYGGPIASLIAIENSDLTGLLLLASAADPDNEKYWWFNNWMKSAFIRAFVNIDLRVANDEKIVHAEENRKLAPQLKNISSPVLVVQGLADKIVLPINAEFLAQKLPPAKTRIDMIEGINHLFIFNEIDLVLEKMQAIVLLAEEN